MKVHIWAGSHVMKAVELKTGLKSLAKLGFECEISKATERYAVKNKAPLLKFLAGNDEIKIRELQNIVENPQAQWLVATRGGYGCLRLLKVLDQMPLNRETELHVWGYSDLTVLQLYLWQRRGWAYVQGPLLSNTLIKLNREERETFLRIAKFGIFPSRFRVKLLYQKSPSLDPRPHLFLGGNLTSLASLLGTPWEPQPIQPFLLFLEDLDEAAYKIDRLLTQVKYSRFFENCRGILLGHFTRCPDYRSVFKAFSMQSQIPVFEGLPMGHEAPRIPLVMGREVILDQGLLRYPNSSINFC